MFDRETLDHRDKLVNQESLDLVVIEEHVDQQDPLDHLQPEVTEAQRNIPVTPDMKLQSFAAVLRGKISLIHVSIATKLANGILVLFHHSLICIYFSNIYFFSF